MRGAILLWVCLPSLIDSHVPLVSHKTLLQTLPLLCHMFDSCYDSIAPCLRDYLVFKLLALSFAICQVSLNQGQFLYHKCIDFKKQSEIARGLMWLV